MNTIRPLVLSLLIIGICSCPAPAATTVSVQAGWGGEYLVGRWAPLFITSQNTSGPRNVVIEVYAPHDPIHAMRIRQFVAIGPTATTFEIFAPLNFVTDELSVSVSDPGTGRTLAKSVPFDYSAVDYRPITAVGQLIGVSGRAGGSGRVLENQLSQDNNRLASRWIEPIRLPAIAQGYDGLTALVLCEPDFATGISLDQQEAIAAWVRGGGHLVCSIGENEPPAISPILDLLPASIGDNTAIELSEAAVRSAGLSPRFRNLKGRILSPKPGADAIPLFTGQAKAYRWNVGFGSVAILPTDPSGFSFNQRDNAVAFWKPLLDGMVAFADPVDSKNSYYQVYNDPVQSMRFQAASRIMDRLGDVPGAGSFGFGYVAAILFAMMLVVGPVDWIVLKKLDRQPWTWITTGGWIALLTIGAMFIGHFFRSGDLHFRTMRLIDQADGKVVASVDAMGIYSPQTQTYAISTDPDGWWEPLASGMSYSSGFKSDLYFHQDYHGNRPLPMQINVWNLRFLTAQTLAAADPVIEANLRVQGQAGSEHLVGQIVNRGKEPLTIEQVILKGHSVNLAQPIAPGASLAVDQQMAQRSPGAVGEFEPGATPDLRDDPGWMLSPNRALQAERLCDSRADIACILARANNVAPAVKIDRPGAVEQHQLFVRALVPLARGGP